MKKITTELTQLSTSATATVSATNPAVITVSTTSGFYVGGYMRFTAASGGSAPWNALASTVHPIMAVDATTITISLDASGFGAFDLTTCTVRPICVIPVTSLAAMEVLTITKANPGVVTTSASHYLNEGDLIQFASLEDMTELNTKICTVGKVTSATSFTLPFSTSGFGSAESGTAGRITLPYGKMLTLSAVPEALFEVPPSISSHTVAHNYIDAAYDSTSDIWLSIKMVENLLFSSGNTSTKLTFYVWSTKIGAEGQRWGYTNYHTLLDTFEHTLTRVSTSGTAYAAPAFGFSRRLGAFIKDTTYRDSVAVSVKLENLDGTSAFFYWYVTGFLYVPQVTDAYGRVDVGLINGATPLAKTDIISASGDGSAIVTRNGRIAGSGGGGIYGN